MTDFYTVEIYQADEKGNLKLFEGPMSDTHCIHCKEPFTRTKICGNAAMECKRCSRALCCTKKPDEARDEDYQKLAFFINIDINIADRWGT